MRYLLDASALLPLLSRFGKKLIATAERERLASTDLAIYEACNVLWKLSALKGVISDEEATATSALLHELTKRDVFPLVSILQLELAETQRYANKEKLTFYDASYVMAAKLENSMLVTEDDKLRKSARGHVEAIGFTNLENRLAQGR